MGEGYWGKREIEHESEKQGNGTATERETKRGTSTATMGLEWQRVHPVYLNTHVFKRKQKVCQISLFAYVIYISPNILNSVSISFFMNHCPQQTRPLECSGAEVGASLATKRVERYCNSSHSDLLWPTVQHKAVQYAASVEMTNMIKYRFRNRWCRNDPALPFPQAEPAVRNLPTLYITYIFPQF